ncbi:MAG TPA: DUF5666 domain-containing protein [Pyrinomonadaceae bacterium]|jgi:hypothetical protein
MKKFYSIGVLCTLALFAAVPLISAQAPNPAGSPPSDTAITPLSVMGVVTSFTPESRQITVKTKAGNEVVVTVNDSTEFLRIPPGEKTKDKFIKITPTDFAVGDMVFARGRMSEDRKNLPAREFYVMSKGDIALKRDREREEWRTRGLSGTVNALNAEKKEITVDARTAEGVKPIVISVSETTTFRRYAPDSIRFGDAKPSSYSEIKVGDQLRARGNKSADGTHFTPDEIVSGAFQTIGGSVTEIKTESREIKINDVQSHQAVTIVVSNDSTMRRLTPELLNALTPPKQATPQSNTKSTGDLQEMFDQLPAVTLADLKVGDEILVSSTKSADPGRVTAIAIVTAVGPLLQSAKSGRGPAVALGAMSLGGP